jgi:hypothetical protein
MGSKSDQRLREYHEARAAYEETGSKEHKAWMLRALRSKDVKEKDVERVADENFERDKDYKRETKEIMRRIGWPEHGFHKKEE